VAAFKLGGNLVNLRPCRNRKGANMVDSTDPRGAKVRQRKIG
jgi:hypothetical protein